ncbi:MAG TPA: DotU family type IV/VI secretion system protein [Pirellulales bacterium]|jgi:type VI secretion system protein ImpK|nr:DotU family type IV/VI secretion system protein [Pirellulales bacterium]
MTPKFAEAVDPVYLHVLELLDRIAAGQNPDPHEERTRLRGWIDQAEGRLGQGQDWALARYALVAWIDEVLIDAQWQGRDWWNENVMEVDLFNTRLANEQFYVRAKEASSLARRDALEVFYICVVLGFRGLYRNPIVAAALAEPRGLPPDLETWTKQTSLAIRLGQGRPTISDVGAPGAGAPPLIGQSLVVWSSLSGAVVAAFTLICVWIVFFGI